MRTLFGTRRRVVASQKRKNYEKSSSRRAKKQKREQVDTAVVAVCRRDEKRRFMRWKNMFTTCPQADYLPLSISCTLHQPAFIIVCIFNVYREYFRKTTGQCCAKEFRECFCRPSAQLLSLPSMFTMCSRICVATWMSGTSSIKS